MTLGFHMNMQAQRVADCKHKGFILQLLEKTKEEEMLKNFKMTYTSYKIQSNIEKEKREEAQNKNNFIF